MAIQTNYTVTDDDDHIESVSVAGDYDAEEDCFIITLHQNGSDVVLTDKMAMDVVDAIHRLLPKKK
jgi:hypothetical protein